MPELDQLLQLSDLNVALSQIADYCKPKDSFEILGIIENNLGAPDKKTPTSQAVYSFIENYALKCSDIDDLDMMLVSLQENGEVTSVYQLQCYVKMAKIAIDQGDISEASKYLSKVNPLKLDSLPLIATQYYILNSQLTRDATQKERSLTKGLEIITSIFGGNSNKLSYEILHLLFDARYRFASFLIETKTKLGIALQLTFENFEIGIKSNSSLLSSSIFKDNFDSFVVLLIIIPYSHAKLQYLSKFSKYLNTENQWISQNLDLSVKSLLLSFINFVIIKFDNKKLFEILQQKFGNDSEDVYNQLIEFDLICISKVFTSIQIRDVIKSLALPSSYTQEQILDLIFKLILDKKIKAELDDVTGYVYFKDDGKDQNWNAKIADVLDKVDYISDKIQAF